MYTESIFRREEFDDASFPGKWSELLFSGRTGSASYGVYDINASGIYQSMKDPNAKWTQVLDAVGADGTRIMEGAGLINANNFVITKACKDPALAMKWVDYWYATRDGYLLTTWGIEGETYKMTDGHPVTLLDNAAEDVKKKWETTRLPDGPIPHISLEDENWAAFQFPETVAFLKLAQPFIFNTSSLKDVIATNEESEVMSKYWDGIWAYQNEMITKFVTGKEPMENWDTFVAQLKTLGAEDITKVKQAQYDRATK
jgi:putative aldouronate transport system substrate-binding protein